MLNHRVLDIRKRRRGQVETETVHLHFLTCDTPDCSCFSYPAQDTEAGAETLAVAQGWRTTARGRHTCPICAMGSANSTERRLCDA